MDRIKLNGQRFHSLFWQQFLLTASIVLLALLLLGASFYALSYNALLTEKRSEMQKNAEYIVSLSGDYLAKVEKKQEKEKEKTQTSDEEEGDTETSAPRPSATGTAVAGPQETTEEEAMLRNLAGVAFNMSDMDFLICDTQGGVKMTSSAELTRRGLTVPKSVMTDISQSADGFEDRSTLGDIYRQKKLITGLPVMKDGKQVGAVLAVVDASELRKLLTSFVSIFFIAASIVLLVAFAASFFMSVRQIQPITEMVQATQAYAAGNLDVRLREEERRDEIGELATSFNQMADALAQTERQRRDFIANISHELKTPMTSIAGYTDGILDGTIPPEKQRNYLRIISDESRRLSRLVRRMLDLSRIQSQELNKVEFDLCESMRLALLSMERKITERNLDVDADIPENEVMVLGDKDLITQVIYNLLENATKFAAQESQLYLGLNILGEKAVVSVRNSGNTIPPEEIPLLFERFHKTDKSRSEDKDGYGLGLYVVKTIIDQHKEIIKVTSEDGVTTFRFTVQMVENA